MIRHYDPLAPRFHRESSGRIDANEMLRLTIGRSWFDVRRDGDQWLIEEHRLGERGAEVRRHVCASAGEAHRLKAQLARDGLIGIGEAI